MALQNVTTLLHDFNDITLDCGLCCSGGGEPEPITNVRAVVLQHIRQATRAQNENAAGVVDHFVEEIKRRYPAQNDDHPVSAAEALLVYAARLVREQFLSAGAHPIEELTEPLRHVARLFDTHGNEEVQLMTQVVRDYVEYLKVALSAFDEAEGPEAQQ